jgi:carbon-monoxide dehydrogenase large subunit
LIDDLVKYSRYEELLRWKRDVNSRFKQQGPLHSNLVAGVGVSIRGGGGFGGNGYEEASEGEESSGGSEHWSSEAGRWPQDAEEGRSQQWTESNEASSGEAGTEVSSADLDFMSEYARVKLDRHGNVTVYTGSSPHGQGEETTFAQLASEELGVPFDQVSVVWGDSILVPFGIGTFGSRSAATGGSAVVDASRKVKAQLIAKASEVTGAEAKALIVRNGKLVNTSQPDAKFPTPAEILEKLGLTEISAESIFRLGTMSYSCGVHLCALTLDPELGKVKIVKYLVVEDCGRMINRAIVEGQLHGGVVHAVGGALFEKLAYDDQGNLLTSTMTDYNIPGALDSPNVEVYHQVTPSTFTLNGAKGVGESGTNAGYAAVMNALNDALSNVRLGAQVNIAPATPDSIFAALTIGPPESDHASDSI